MEKEELRKALKLILKDGIVTSSMITLTGGVFLVDFSLKLGASNALIGLIASFPFICQAFQAPSVYAVYRLGRRKAICVLSSTLARSVWLLVGLLPLFPDELSLKLLVILIFINSSLSSISSCSWNSWMKDVVPEERLGRFFSTRMSVSTAISTSLSLLAAFYVELFSKRFPDKSIFAYSSLFLLGGLIGLSGIGIMRKIPEPPMEPVRVRGPELIKDLIEPLKDKNFRNLILFLSVWGFSINLSAPFFTVYMIKRLELGISFIVALTVINQVANAISVNIWGKLSDRFGNRSVLSVCSMLFLICVIAWTFTTLPERHSFTIPILIVVHVLMGISSAGISLTSGNISLKLAPRKKGISYLATKNIVSSFLSGISPILGGVVADMFMGKGIDVNIVLTNQPKVLVLSIISMKNWDLLFLISFVLGIFSLNFLSRVAERGVVEDKAVLHEFLEELKRPLRSFSTASGISKIYSVPASITLKFARKFRNQRHL